jgi:hypothetical protein
MPAASPKPKPLCLKRYAPTSASSIASVRVALLRRTFQIPFLVYAMFQSPHRGNVHRLQKSTCVYLNHCQLLMLSYGCLYALTGTLLNSTHPS